ncbi:MAG: hypothetical protein WDA24_00630 [Tissierellales bacterium]
MNNEEIIAMVDKSANEIISTKGYIAAVDILIKMDILSYEDYEKWRFGKVPYLEKICKVNLNKMALIMKTLKKYARLNNLQPSCTAYKKWGKGNKIDLQFSKTGSPSVEKEYSTHYVKKEQ